MDSLKNEIERSRWLRALPENVAQAVLSGARERTFLKGEAIYHIGDPPGGVFGVISGIVAIQTDDSGTGIVNAHLFGPGNWFGENAALSLAPRAVGAVVKSEKARVRSLSLQAIEKLGAENPAFWRALAGLCAINSAIAVQTARDLMIRNPEDRCMAVLARLQASLPPCCEVPLSQEELATMCALSRGSVSRVLKKLERANALSLGYGTITLHAG